MRSKRYGLVACLAALSLFAGCYLNLGGLKGSGIVKTESREVAGFSSISSKSVGKVTVQQTGKESLTITADDNILPLLESRVADNILYLTIAKDGNMNPTKPIEFVVEVKSLSGVGSFQGENFQTKQATVRHSGVGSAVVNVSEQLDATVSGVGSVEYIGSPQVRQESESVRGMGSVKKR